MGRQALRSSEENAQVELAEVGPLIYYFYLFCVVNVVSLQVAFHGPLLKFAVPCAVRIFDSQISENTFLNWVAVVILPISWVAWLVFTGWMVTCFEAAFVTPLAYAMETFYG